MSLLRRGSPIGIPGAQIARTDGGVAEITTKSTAVLGGPHTGLALGLEPNQSYAYGFVNPDTGSVSAYNSLDGVVTTEGRQQSIQVEPEATVMLTNRGDGTTLRIGDQAYDLGPNGALLVVPERAGAVVNADSDAGKTLLEFWRGKGSGLGPESF